jgi:hypothetical protein
MLSDGHKYRLVVSRSVDGRDLVHALWKPLVYVGGKNSALLLIVQTLEKREGIRVTGFCGIQRVEFLDDDV